YHWTNLELKQFFGVKEPLKESNAKQIYDFCNRKITEESLSPVTCIQSSKVKLICTTDDPADDLHYHKLIAEKNYDFDVLPTFRPDKALSIRKEGFNEYIQQLSQSAKTRIDSYDDLLVVLKARMDFFQELGCKISDHSLESLEYISTSDDEVRKIFNKRRDGYEITPTEAEKYKNYTLMLLAKEYHDRGWVMQLHLGAMRNNNDVMFEKVGPDTGFDIMNDFAIAPHLSKLLNEMNKMEALPRTILYTLNPKDNIILSALPHCYSEDNIPGKVQFGTAWWFMDHKEGIQEHLKSIASQGMLADFVGMLTDSRSFLSYARHDYFRRIVSSYIGGLVDDGEYEKDDAVLSEIIEGICYKNIKKYLNIIE
ncbi:MAG: glucuronate isomerase, partial [Firmicutes bacterium]|nr:glucuronate isomerase [Bacillota bacterium]